MLPPLNIDYGQVYHAGACETILRGTYSRREVIPADRTIGARAALMGSLASNLCIIIVYHLLTLDKYCGLQRMLSRYIYVGINKYHNYPGAVLAHSDK